MKVIGIETSCDETAVSVIEGDGEKIKVLSNVISSQIKLHAKYGGVVPNLAAREHVKNIKHVFEAALKSAGIKDFKKEIDLITITRGPGLGPALLVGLTFARTIADYYDIPLVGVNHMDGHIHSNWLNQPDIKNIFSALNLLVSGGHTELVLMKGHGKYQIIGETLDDAVGEAFDKAARILGLGYPGGPAISKLAEKGNPDIYPLPQPMLHSKNYDFSYSGLKTAVLYLVRDLGGTTGLSAGQKADIAASFQKAAVEVLISKTARAAEEYGAKSVLLSGGVSANKLLRQRLKETASAAGIKFFCPAMEYTTDNAAMIAAAGYFAYNKNPPSRPSFVKTSKDKKASARRRKTASYEAVKMDANLTL